MLAGRKWDSKSDVGSFALSAFDLNLSAHKMRALSHAEQAQRLRTRLLALGDPSTIVFYRHQELAGFLPGHNRHLRGFGVTQNIRKSFLKNAEDRSRLLIAQIDFI